MLNNNQGGLDSGNARNFSSQFGSTNQSQSGYTLGGKPTGQLLISRNENKAHKGKGVDKRPLLHPWAVQGIWLVYIISHPPTICRTPCRVTGEHACKSSTASLNTSAFLAQKTHAAGASVDCLLGAINSSRGGLVRRIFPVACSRSGHCLAPFICTLDSVAHHLWQPRLVVI